MPKTSRENRVCIQSDVLALELTSGVTKAVEHQGISPDSKTTRWSVTVRKPPSACELPGLCYFDIHQKHSDRVRCIDPQLPSPASTATQLVASAASAAVHPPMSDAATALSVFWRLACTSCRRQPHPTRPS